MSDLSLANKMTGKDLVALVRPRWPRTAFVLVSGSATQLSPAEAARANVDEVLYKPFSVTDLRRVVARLIAQPRTNRANRREAS